MRVGVTRPLESIGKAARAVRFAVVSASALAAAATCLPESAAQPQPVGAGGRISGYVTLMSDYRNRGLSQSAGEPALQIGADYQHRSGFFAGGRAVNVEYDLPRSGPETHAEAVIYAGYNRRVDRWSLTGSLGRYAYPGSDYDWDYGEAGASVGYRDRVFLTASYSDDFFGLGAAAWNRELSFAHPLGSGFEIGAGIGRFRASSIGVDYTHWNVGASKRVAGFGIDLRYYDTSLDPATDAADRYDSASGGSVWRDDGLPHGYTAAGPAAIPPGGSESGGRWVLSVSYGIDGGR